MQGVAWLCSVLHSLARAHSTPFLFFTGKGGVGKTLALQRHGSGSR